MKGTALTLASAAAAAALFITGCGEKTPELSNWTCSAEQLEKFEDQCKEEGMDALLNKYSPFFKQCRAGKLGKFNPEMEKLVSEINRCGVHGVLNEEPGYKAKCSAPFIKEREALLAKWKSEDE